MVRLSNAAPQARRHTAACSISPYQVLGMKTVWNDVRLQLLHAFNNSTSPDLLLLQKTLCVCASSVRTRTRLRIVGQLNTMGKTIVAAAVAVAFTLGGPCAREVFASATAQHTITPQEDTLNSAQYTRVTRRLRNGNSSTCRTTDDALDALKVRDTERKVC